MRVIAGKARSLRLKSIEGLETRPTTDRIKETLFNMINTDVYDARFLDMFAGSGGIGIEALSRGSKRCVFVDNNIKCIKCIEDNLKFTKLYDSASLMCQDALTAISKLEYANEQFDVIFIDPPYKLGIEEMLLQKLGKSSIINDDTLVIIEADIKTDFGFIEDMDTLEIIKVKEYKTNKHVFIMKTTEEEAD
ncbi:MAG: 16S rRNA (guanine(966)-N(2))-methyltransferase RsmD [Lachnospiraceae bacterium]|nr:16S rRNA (guanine(966)-N(2))-methyltransferase RsmD [Lachnospiraceae bacterium]